MENPVENALSTATFLSFRQLKNKLNLPKRTIKYHISQSKRIKNRDPLLHGSMKKKIGVYELTNIIIPENNKKRKYEDLTDVIDEPDYEIV